VATPSAPDKSLDPEAEQEVDFARYFRMLARRWWLVAIGVVAGAVIGFLLSLGGAKVYSATSTIYLGQPTNPGGTSPIFNLQTNPSAVAQFANAQSVDQKVATQCKTTVKTFRKGISVQKVATASSVTKSLAAVNPLVTVTVQAPKGKAAACVANGLARAAAAGISAYPALKIKNYVNEIAIDNAAIKNINAVLANPAASQAETSVALLKLPAYQQDLQTYLGLVSLAKTSEMPQVTIRAAARQVTAQSSHNTVVIAALIGLILGIIAALLWDRIFPSRNGS
jgi:capsular polysaccharide biosynthesis protein